MKTISDVIEMYLCELLSRSDDGMIEVQRSELAESFSCVPSQINYVIATRFTPPRGYLVESKRGGGGYIRIRRIASQHINEISQLLQAVGDSIPQKEAEGIIWRLESDRVLSQREASLLRVAVSRETLLLPLPDRDILRARLLSLMLAAVYGYRSNDS